MLVVKMGDRLSYQPRASRLLLSKLSLNKILRVLLSMGIGVGTGVGCVGGLPCGVGLGGVDEGVGAGKEFPTLVELSLVEDRLFMRLGFSKDLV